MLKDYKQICCWESWPCGSLFGISPLRLFLLLNTVEFLFSFRSPIAQPLPERRRDIHPCVWRTARTLTTSTVRACTLTWLHGLRTTGALRGGRWNTAFPGIACKGLRPVVAVWSEHAVSLHGSYGSLPHKFLLPIFVSLQTNIVSNIPSQPQHWLSAHVYHHPNMPPEVVQ